MNVRGAASSSAPDDEQMREREREGHLDRAGLLCGRGSTRAHEPAARVVEGRPELTQEARPDHRCIETGDRHGNVGDRDASEADGVETAVGERTLGAAREDARGRHDGLHADGLRRPAAEQQEIAARVQASLEAAGLLEVA